MNTEKASALYSWATLEYGGPFVFDYISYLVDEHTGELIN